MLILVSSGTCTAVSPAPASMSTSAAAEAGADGALGATGRADGTRVPSRRDRIRHPAEVPAQAVMRGAQASWVMPGTNAMSDLLVGARGQPGTRRSGRDRPGAGAADCAARRNGSRHRGLGRGCGMAATAGARGLDRSPGAENCRRRKRSTRDEPSRSRRRAHPPSGNRRPCRANPGNDPSRRTGA